jgi:hypothetical protein
LAKIKGNLVETTNGANLDSAFGTSIEFSGATRRNIENLCFEQIFKGNSLSKLFNTKTTTNTKQQTINFKMSHNFKHAVEASDAAMRENVHHYNAEAAKYRAKDHHRGVVERVEASGHYVAEKMKEGGASVSYHHHKEQAKHF